MKLEDIIRKEIQADFFIDNEPDAKFQAVLDEVTGKTGTPMDPADSEKLMKHLSNLEYWYFSQGFMRGIAATKGGFI